MDVYLRDKFEVSSVILTSFRQVGGGGGGEIKTPPPPPKITSPPLQLKTNP